MEKLVNRSFNTFMIVLCLIGNLDAKYMSEPNNKLSKKQQSFIPIAAYCALGDFQKLKGVLDEGLNAGLTINEIKEVIVHLYAYCGFPRSIRGLQTFMEVLDERKSKGTTDILGAEASDIIIEKNKYEVGKNNLEKLTGIPQSELKSGYAEFAPIIDIFLKEHLFADIFERDVLTFAERELITISVLASIGRVEPMLRSHLQICLTQGFTPQQLNEFLQIISSAIGKKEILATEEVLKDILKNYNK